MPLSGVCLPYSSPKGRHLGPDAFACGHGAGLFVRPACLCGDRTTATAPTPHEPIKNSNIFASKFQSIFVVATLFRACFATLCALVGCFSDIAACKRKQAPAVRRCLLMLMQPENRYRLLCGIGRLVRAVLLLFVFAVIGIPKSDNRHTHNHLSLIHI